MTKQELVGYLLEKIEYADPRDGDLIQITRTEAAEIVRLLSGRKEEVPVVQKNAEGQILFFCSDCNKSYWDAGREDKECFRKWKYHTWVSNCPTCNREVTRNDRYWR